MWPGYDKSESNLLNQLILDKYIHEVYYELYLPKKCSLYYKYEIYYIKIHFYYKFI